MKGVLGLGYWGKTKKVVFNPVLEIMSLMRKIPLDTKIGLVIFSFFLFVFLAIIPNQIDLVTETMEIEKSSPRIYPQISIVIIIFLSILLIINSIRKRKTTKESELKSTAIMTSLNIRVLIMMLVSIAYIFFFVKFLGFLLSSMIVLAFLIRFYGYRSRLITILMTALLPLIFFCFFKVSLHITLPIGNIFQ